jgi:hypothetical protein
LKARSAAMFDYDLLQGFGPPIAVWAATAPPSASGRKEAIEGDPDAAHVLRPT